MHKLPRGWCRSIDKIARNFLWKGSACPSFKFVSVSWKRVYTSKFQGGLGVRRLLELIWVKALKAKYFPHSSFMCAGRKKSQSWQWRGILSVRSVLTKDIYFRVGKGNSINYWEDLWIPNNPNFQPSPNPNSLDIRIGMVDSLLLDNGEWSRPLLESLFDSASIRNIMKIFWGQQFIR